MSPSLLVQPVLVREISTLTLPHNVDGGEGPEQSFDFSESPNLQKVHFRVSWIAGDLRWIPTALSTLRPATSPRLSAVKLEFRSSTTNPPVESSVEAVGRGLRRVANEVSRIEREFQEIVNVTVFRDEVFQMALWS